MQNHIYLKIIAAKKLVEIKIKLFAPTSAKGMSEIALVGVAPAIANAVFNATGKRIRQLPITPDKLM